MDHIGLGNIAKATMDDPVLSQIQVLLREGKTWIPKDADKKLARYRSILPELMISGNGIIFKGDKIILPESRQEKALALAHQGSHPAKVHYNPDS